MARRHPGALSLALVSGVAHHYKGLRGIPGILWIALPALVGAGIMLALSAMPKITRMLLADRDIDRRVQLRAQAAFLQEEVFATEARTGILIFVAVFEQRALILADTGIHRKVPPGTWERVVASRVAAAASEVEGHPGVGEDEKIGE